MSQTRTYHSFFATKNQIAERKEYQRFWQQKTGTNFGFLEPYPFANPWTFRDGKWWWKRSLMSDASWCFVACLCRCFGERVEGRESAAIWYKVRYNPQLPMYFKPIYTVFSNNRPGAEKSVAFCVVVGKLNQLLKIQETIDLLGSHHFDPPSGDQFFVGAGFQAFQKTHMFFFEKRPWRQRTKNRKPNTFVGKGLVTGIFNLQISCFLCKVQLFIRVISSKASSSILWKLFNSTCPVKKVTQTPLFLLHIFLLPSILFTPNATGLCYAAFW